MTTEIKRNTNISWMEDEEFFESQYNIGKNYEIQVQRKLQEYGLEVECENSSFREKINQISEFTKNSGDLIIYGHKFEVKSRTERFTCPENWRYWPMFVDTVAGIEAKSIPPLGYIFISQKTRCLMGVSLRSKPNWTKLKKFDRRRQIIVESYCVNKCDVFDEETLVKKAKKSE